MLNFRTNFSTPVKFIETLPKISYLKKSRNLNGCDRFLLIYDKVLLTDSTFKKWAGKFHMTYPVDGGEKLKDLNCFPKHVEKIGEILSVESSKSLCIVSAGGGSVGDFSGFFASVYKRGVRLVHLPTTWLATLDSAHGGKTALNLGGIKNQVGSFFPASIVLVVKEMLRFLPEEQLISGYGEMVKMALLAGGKLYKDRRLHEVCTFENMWESMPAAISAKYKVVKRDPYEEKGERQVLNLGHTFGHVIEVNYKISHGLAVGLGTRFALNWSRKRGYLTKSRYSKMVTLLELFQVEEMAMGRLNSKKTGRMSRERFEAIVSADKKRIGSTGITFIFLTAAGKPIRKTVTIKQIVAEAIRQGWVQ